MKVVARAKVRTGDKGQLLVRESYLGGHGHLEPAPYSYLLSTRVFLERQLQVSSCFGASNIAAWFRLAHSSARALCRQCICERIVTVSKFNTYQAEYVNLSQ